MQPATMTANVFARKDQSVEQHDRTGKDVNVKRRAVGAGERRLAALQEERIEIGRKIIGIVRQNRDQHSQDQQDREPAKNRRQNSRSHETDPGEEKKPRVQKNRRQRREQRRPLSVSSVFSCSFLSSDMLNLSQTVLLREFRKTGGNGENREDRSPFPLFSPVRFFLPTCS